MNILQTIAGIFLSLATFFGYHQPTQVPVTFGSVTPVQGTSFFLAGAGITATANTIQLTSFQTPDGRNLTMSMFGTIGYGALEPGTSKLEDITFTGITQNGNGTATLTGVTRGNDFVTPYAASTTLSKAHSGGSTFILSNTAGFYTQFMPVNNTATSTATLVFSSTTPPTYDGEPVWANFTTKILADVTYVNSVVAAGAANASETVKGIIQLATGAQAAAGTSSGSTGARLALGANLASSTPSATTPTGTIPTTVGRYLSQAWLDLSAAWTFTGGLTVLGSNTTLATTTVNGMNVHPTFGGTGVGGALSITTGTTTIDLANAAVVVKNYTSISITGTGGLAFINPNTNGTVIILKSQGNVTLTSSATPTIDASGLGGAGGAAVTSSSSFLSGNAGSNSVGSIMGGGGGAPGTSNPGAGGVITGTVSVSQYLSKYAWVMAGAGGASGSGFETLAGTGTSGAGGRGGGGLVIECGGAWNFTTTGGITVAGLKGGNGSGSQSGNGGGGGGGGAGGTLLALYNTLVANTGTALATAGVGGNNNSSLGGDPMKGGGGGSNFLPGATGISSGTDAAKTGGDGATGTALVVLNTEY